MDRLNPVNPAKCYPWLCGCSTLQGMEKYEGSAIRPNLNNLGFIQ